MGKDQTQVRVTMLSTWPPQACGVGQYAYYLAQGYHQNKAEVSVLSEQDVSFSLAGGQVQSFFGIGSLGSFGSKGKPWAPPVERTWQRDIWTVDDLVTQVIGTKPDVLDVQHEFGIWPDSFKLAILLSQLATKGIKIVVTLHTATTLGHHTLRGLLSEFYHQIFFVVHSALMRSAWHSHAVILPHPTPDLLKIYQPDPFKHPQPEQPEVFASIGFISPGKRLDENLRALSRLNAYPWTYIIAGEEAGNLVSEDKAINVPIRRYVLALGMNDRVKVITDYLDQDYRIEIMKGASLVILNHRGVNAPSVSGAARDVLALGIPSVSSRSYMYDELPAAVSPKFSTEAELLGLLESRFWRDPNWVANAQGYFEAARRWDYRSAAEARLLL